MCLVFGLGLVWRAALAANHNCLVVLLAPFCTDRQTDRLSLCLPVLSEVDVEVSLSALSVISLDCMNKIFLSFFMFMVYE